MSSCCLFAMLIFCDLELMMQCRLDAYFSSSRATARIRIHDHLPVIAQVHGVELAELLPPFLRMRQVNFVTLKEVSISQMKQHPAMGIGRCCLQIFRVVD